MGVRRLRGFFMDKGKQRLLLMLKNDFSILVAQLLPGYLRIIDAIVRAKYGMRAIDLLFDNPSKLYEALKEYYGDEASAEIAFFEVFLRPLVRLLGYKVTEHELLQKIKRGEDREVVLKILSLYSHDKAS